jgi:hypothetical protein
MKLIILLTLILSSCNSYDNIYQQRMAERKEESLKMFHQVHKVRKKCSSGRKPNKIRKKPKYTN